jgi:hypothetical protein
MAVVKQAFVRSPTVQRAQVARPDQTVSEEEEPAPTEAPKKKGSALPLLVGAAAVVFLMAKK